MAQNDIGDWYRSIPIVSRWWFSASVIVPLAARFGLLNPYYLFLSWELVAYKFQIWRLLSCIVYFPLSPQTGFRYLINMYFLYSYSTRLESGLFDGRPADHLFLITFNSICLVMLGFIIPLYLLMEPLVLSVLYVWCQLNKDVVVQFWFGTQFKAMYLPWVLAVFNMILGDGGVKEIVGICVGHLYFFLMFKYPQDFGGQRFLSTPEFMYKFLPSRRGGVSGFGVAPASRREQEPRPDGPGFRWPTGGQRLGNED